MHQKAWASALPARARLFAVCAVAWAGPAGAEGPPEPTDEGAAVSAGELEELLESSGAPAASQSRAYGPADFEPYFASGELLRAKSLFDRKRHRQARAILEREGDTPPVRLLRALAALRGGDPATAERELSELAEDYPALKDHCLLMAGQAREALHRWADAAASYAAVSADSSAFADARFGLSRVLARRGKLDEAIEALTPLRELPISARNAPVRMRALMKVVQLTRRQGDYRAEHRVMLEVWAASPFSRHAEAVLPRLKQLPIPNKWRVRRAEVLMALNHNDAALRLADQVKEPLPSETACRAGFIIGNTLRKERQHRRAIEELGPVVEKCVESEVRPQAMYVMGYSQSVVHPDEAIRTYEALAREYAEHAFADDALFFAGELHARRGDEATALERFVGCASRYPHGNFAEEALFNAAWIHRRRGDRPRALAALEELEKLPNVRSERLLRARYWQARIREEAGDSSASGLFARLAAQHPASWYGLLAMTRTGAAAPAVAPEPSGSAGSWPLEAGPLAADRRFLEGIELIRLGLDGADDALLAIHRQGLPESSARLLVEALRRAGRERAANVVTRVTLGRELEGGVAESSRPIWEATFPRPFRGVVERHAKAAGVDPDLVQALMREESRFNRYARSSTGALGLTQLMPATARKVARSLKLGRVSEGALLRPQLNIRLGSAYLGMLLEEFGGSTVHAVAAYNAGTAAVNRWIRANPDVAVDEWVELIPFSETREYVKRVVGSLGAYRLVYGEGQPLALESLHHPPPIAVSSGR